MSKPAETIDPVLINVTYEVSGKTFTTLEEVLAFFMPLDTKTLLTWSGKPHLVMCAQFLAYVKHTYPNQLRSESLDLTKAFNICFSSVLLAPQASSKAVKGAPSEC